jgi:hypothetical protein
MSYGSPTLGGLSAPSGFAPADFGDAEDMQPLGAAFDIGGNGSATPYSDAVGAMVTKHMDEIRGKTATALQLAAHWKKRLREFLNQKNTELLDFLSLRPSSHPAIGPGELLLRRFGNPQVTPSHPSVREFLMDVSGEDVIGEISTVLTKAAAAAGGGLQGYAEQTRCLFEEYRVAGDAVLTQQAALKAKLDALDRVQGKLTGLFEIQPNSKFEPLAEATEAYLKLIFEENQIEKDYKALITAYRRFAAMRDTVTLSRTLLAQESEPICSICLNESVSFALVPCGHTFCATCMRRQNGTCYMCRNAIRDRVKLFFG